jgi:hypothetical protein
MDIGIRPRALIREFSRPLTRSDWKRRPKMTHSEFGCLLFASTRLPITNSLMYRTFSKSVDVLSSKYTKVPFQKGWCAFHNNGCTTKGKTSCKCEHCDVNVCRKCIKCPNC